jgi:hypothetical protein
MADRIIAYQLYYPSEDLTTLSMTITSSWSCRGLGYVPNYRRQPVRDVVLSQGRLRLFLIMTSRAAVLGHRKYPVVRSSSRSQRFSASCQGIVDRLPMAKCTAAIRCIEAKLDTQSIDNVVSMSIMSYRLIVCMTCFMVMPGDRAG